jgi:hypothetical protein
MADWRRRSACRKEGPELIFFVGTDGSALPQVTEGEAVRCCCPVMKERLRWVLVTWISAAGGVSELHVRVPGMYLTLTVRGTFRLAAGGVW